jgi:hypothetical protein
LKDTIKIKINGIGVVVDLEDQRLIDWLKFDFSMFLVEDFDRAELTVRVTIGRERPKLPNLVASTQTPHYVSYDDGAHRYVDYFGRALVDYNYDVDHGEIYSADPTFAYERLFLLILSRCGEKLDHRGLHRVHALGATFDDKALLFLMPEHGGKSTLGLSIMEHPRFKFLSDDAPLIDHKGQVYPSPLRIGLRSPDAAKGIPSEYVRTFLRDGRDTKTVIKMSYFAERIEKESKPIQWIFIGQWINHNDPRIEPVSAFAVYATLFRDCVFGLGLAQVIEYFLRSKRNDLLAKTGIVFKRVCAVTVLLLRGRSRRFLLGPNADKNKDCLIQFLETGI